MALRPDQLELVHRFFDGELNRDEQAEVEALLSGDGDARGALRELRSLDRSTRNELLAATAQEDFTDWWDHVEQQMKAPSLEPPTGVEPIQRRSTISMVRDEIHASPVEPAPSAWRGWLIAGLFAGAAIGSAIGVFALALN
ncbi:MAG: hypothetical protein GY898_34535 [Proteobacteria bacterium]|nr:hypothetical protein [Pseudomonadota bacterium]